MTDLTGTNKNNKLTGTDNDDTLNGGLGNDTLIGGAGMDTALWNTSSSGFIIYRDNADYITVMDTNDTTATGFGKDRVYNDVEQLKFNDVTIDIASLNLTLNGEGWGRAAITSGDSGNNSLNGTASADQMGGNDGNDRLDGKLGNDILNGDAGNDVITGGLGSDLLKGGAGDDMFNFSADMIWAGYGAQNAGSPGHAGSNEIISINGYNRNTDVMEGGDGKDTMKCTSGNDYFALDDSFSASPNGYTPRLVSVEIIKAGAGNDIIDFTSWTFSYGNVTIDGEAGNDVLWSSSGDDSLIGGTGNDSLDGGFGVDTLSGGAGSDTLMGGAGADSLTGGADADIFIFTDATSADKITDFKMTQNDVLNLSHVASGFVSGTSNIADYLQFVASGRDIIVNLDMDGAANGHAWANIALLSGAKGLDAATLLAHGEIIF